MQEGGRSDASRNSPPTNRDYESEATEALTYHLEADALQAGSQALDAGTRTLEQLQELSNAGSRQRGG